MNQLLIEEAFDSIIGSCYRSVIVEDNALEGVSEDYCTITKVSDNVNYVTLTEKGVACVLTEKGLSEEDSNSIINFIHFREEQELEALVGYLKLEQELSSSVVFILLRDGSISIDDRMSRKSYNIPLDLLFKAITDNKFKPFNVSEIETSEKITEKDYGKHLFSDKTHHKLLSVFVDVTKQE